MENSNMYAAIDLKSFYASVECRERGLDPLAVNLVVADISRTEKTICLAVSPTLKAYGISGRARLFEVIQRVDEINRYRLGKLKGRGFSGESCVDSELRENPGLKLSYIVAPPRMAFYIDYSTKIYNVYLKYIAPEDIHVYSIDEVFIDLTQYMKLYNLSAHELTRLLINEVLKETGITATAGIAPNLYLAKIAMDIVGKHVPADSDGVRIAELDEMSYRRRLWTHRPITDFWRVGRGYAKRLAAVGLFTMGDIARCSLGGPNDYYNEDLLYRMFGIYAELLIDHAWGWEPALISDIRSYKPSSKSLESGQVLKEPYPYDRARLIVKEMAQTIALDLVKKKLVTDQIVLTLGYDAENLSGPGKKINYDGEIKSDRYGRRVPKHAHGTERLDVLTSSGRLIMEAALVLFDRIADKRLSIRRITITAGRVIEEGLAEEKDAAYNQMSFFSDGSNIADINLIEKQKEEESKTLKKEHALAETVLSLKEKFGKNAVLKGTNLERGATAIERNEQIGGHKA